MKIKELSQKTISEYLPGLLDILAQQMRVIGAECSPEYIRASVDNILKPDSRARLFIATDDKSNQPTAVCLGNIGSGVESGGDYLWINEIHVKEEYRRSGVGRELLEFVLKWAREKNCRAALSMTDLGNEAAQSLFHNVGFEASDIVWLAKSL